MSESRLNETLPTIRAVVFDFDGLMVNTEDVFQMSGTELLRRRGKEPTPAIFHGMMGRRSHEALAYLIEVMGLNDTVEQLQEITAFCDHAFKRHTGDLSAIEKPALT